MKYDDVLYTANKKVSIQNTGAFCKTSLLI